MQRTNHRPSPSYLSRLRCRPFSVGSTTVDLPSRVHLGGCLNDEDRRQLNEDGAVGDIATQFFKAHGSSEGIRLNARATGMEPDDLRQIPMRVCVAQGLGKADALLGALRGGDVTHLVADQALIDQVIKLARSAQLVDWYSRHVVKVLDVSQYIECR